MSRELSLEINFDIPQGKRETLHLLHFFRGCRAEIGVWGEGGRDVGIGFTWYTRTGFDNSRLHLLVRRVKRALRSASIVFGRVDSYNLEQRIIYIRDGDGHGILTLKEDS